MAGPASVPPQTYQDWVLEGQTVAAGARDCLGRWELLRPHVPPRACVLDVGSNLGWFGWKITQDDPGAVVASVEANESSATLQRQMLASHQSDRICLLTARADARMAQVFADAQQRFDLVLCLSVLHWLPDHRQFLSVVGNLARRILVEQPDPRESGAGYEQLRQEIGAIGPYLQALFPNRPVRRLAQMPSHRECPYPREIWLVEEAAPESTGPEDSAAALDVRALLQLSPSWPPRAWWLEQALRSSTDAAPSGPVRLTARGLEGNPVPASLQRHLARLPQDRLLTPSDWCSRRLRRLGGKILRGLGLRRTLR